MMFMKIYKNYNPTKKRKVLLVFDGMIADMEANKKLNPVVTEFFLRERNSLIFISQSYFEESKTIRLNLTHYFIMKIRSKKELQQIASNHSSDIEFKDFMKLYNNYTKEPFSFLVKDTALPSDNSLRFRKNLL